MSFHSSLGLDYVANEDLSDVRDELNTGEGNFVNLENFGKHEYQGWWSYVY